MKHKSAALIQQVLEDLMETLSTYYRHEFTDEQKTQYRQAHAILEDEQNQNLQPTRGH